MHFFQLGDNKTVIIAVLAIILLLLFCWSQWRKRHQTPKSWREHVCSTLSSFELVPLRDLPPTAATNGHDCYVLDDGKTYLVALSSQQPGPNNRIELPKETTNLVDTLGNPYCRIVENYYQEIEVDRFGKEHRKTTPKEIRYVIYAPNHSVCNA